MLPNSKFKNLLITLFSPNEIRRHSNREFKQKMILVKSAHESANLLVDLNDEIGYRFFFNKSGDDTALLVSEVLDLTSDDIFLDIGANIGTVSIPLALKFGCEVIAFEASFYNSAQMNYNLHLNPIRCKFHNVLLTDEDTYTLEPYKTLFLNHGNYGANSIHNSWNPSKIRNRVEVVKTNTLDNLLNSDEISKIKLIKIDVEGAEEEVLTGFNSRKLTDAPILFEYRVDIMHRDLGFGGDKLLSIMRSHHEIFGIEREGGFVYLVEFDENRPYGNAIGFPKPLSIDYQKLFQFKQLKDINS